MGAGRKGLAAGLAAMIGLAIGACEPSAYRCVSDAECAGAGAGAFCDPLGLCAVADPDCPSGASYAKHSGTLAGQCVAELDAPDEPLGFEPLEDEGEPGREEPGRDGDGPPGDGDDIPDDEPDGDDPAPRPSTDAFPGGAPAQCDNGRLDAGESDVDCGGPCSACAECLGCGSTADCEAGLECAGGQCRLTGELFVDWLENCGPNGGELDPATLELPRGSYVVRAVPSAGSKWADDDLNQGQSWGWWLECEGFDFGDMRTPYDDWWYATSQDAFDAVMVPQLEAAHAGGVITCGVTDATCGDNRGETIVHFERSCP